MTRGKRQQIVQPRRANDALEADLGTYQRRVRDLTAEVRQLRAQLREQLARHQQTERRLRAERDQGVAPKVEALELLLEKARAEAKQQRDAAYQMATQQVRGRHMLLDLLRAQDVDAFVLGKIDALAFPVVAGKHGGRLLHDFPAEMRTVQMVAPDNLRRQVWLDLFRHDRAALEMFRDVYVKANPHVREYDSRESDEDQASNTG